MRTSNLQIPTVENVDGKLSVKFSTKTYPEFLKDNTQTNLRSVDLGDGNYSYTVQRNIVFATQKVEKIEQPKVEKPIVESKPNIDIEAKKTEIEKIKSEIEILENKVSNIMTPIEIADLALSNGVISKELRDQIKGVEERLIDN